MLAVFDHDPKRKDKDLGLTVATNSIRVTGDKTRLEIVTTFVTNHYPLIYSFLQSYIRLFITNCGTGKDAREPVRIAQKFEKHACRLKVSKRFPQPRWRCFIKPHHMFQFFDSAGEL